MAIPDYQSLMLPTLRHYSDGQEHSSRDAVEALAKVLKLSAEDRKEMLPSGQQEVFDNRIGWARTYMKKAGLLDSPRRGYNKITKRGLDVLKTNPERIDIKFLKQYKEFQTFQSLRHSIDDAEQEQEMSEKTPEELLESAYQRIRADLATDILQRMKSCSPKFFERLVVEVIVKMGYGGNRFDAGRAIGRSGDGGIDGIIKEDKLGLDTIYIQAKRWENTVGRPEVQKFVGALTGQRAKKGLFIITSNFTEEAHIYVSGIDPKIVLIDGETLAQHMIDHGVGVSIVGIFELKRIDSDYFTEE